MNKSSQQGLTLIELMVALVLGLLIVAAGLAVFLNAQRSMGFQTSMGDIQQNANFGLSMLTQDLRHANLNTPSSQQVNNKLVGSGIVFVNANLPSAVHTNTENRLTAQEANDDATGTKKSDQLTIQYRAPFDSYDCEGRGIHQGDMVIERYFTRTDRQRAKNETKASAIVLACDAGGYQLIPILKNNTQVAPLPLSDRPN